MCLASFGHIREIADGLKSINVERDFETKFAIMPSKQAQVAKLRAAIASASEVILATDDDREGEAIAWHLCQVFHLSVLTTKRIIFHEITEPALRAAIAAPRTIDMSVVMAQHARQILDMVVGYKISPVLWTYVAHTNLSAGRCQTPALRLIYENYKEIETSNDELVYTVSGVFTKLNLTFHLSREIASVKSLEHFISETSKAVDTGFRASVGAPKKTTKSPPQPYSTSTLQQAASNELHLSPKDTMSVAQKLYEQGYITYMRTDSKVYSADFVTKACEYIRKRFAGAGTNSDDDLIGKSMIPKMSSGTAKNGDSAAAAHEAIRPTDISRTLLPQSCHPREHRLYSMIQRNTLESLMAPAICQTLTMSISSPVTVRDQECREIECDYRYTAEQVIKPGWKLVAGGYDKDAKEYTYFASLATSTLGSGLSTSRDCMPFKKIMTKCSLRNTKSHYTESGLVQLLEKMGIGRPSTFSSLVDKIQERGYVKLQDVRGKSLECREFIITEDKKVELKTEVREIGGESRKLVIQPLGIIVIEFLLEHFGPLFEYEFTKNMENQLDEIATGGMIWHELCYKCWFDVTTQLQELKERGVVKEEIQIDENHSYIMARNGPVIRCRVSQEIQSDDDDDDISEPGDTDNIEKKPKFIFKSVRPNLEYAKILRGEYSLAYMLGEEGANGDGGGCAITSTMTSVPTPTAVAGGGRLMGKYQGQDVIIKSGKYGAYIVWGSINISLRPLLGGSSSPSPVGKFIRKPIYEKTTNQKSEFDLTLQDVITFIESTRGCGGGEEGATATGSSSTTPTTSATTTPFQGQILRTIDENTTIRYGRYGPYIFHKTQKMTKPVFVALKGFAELHGNYITCDAEIIREWIEKEQTTPAKPKPKIPFKFYKK
jgi:DNA topoisomerase-1